MLTCRTTCTIRISIGIGIGDERSNERSRHSDSEGRAMRVLAITQIWPNRVEPHRTPFNLQQFKCLRERGDCEVEVIDAIAYLPGAKLLSRSRALGQSARAFALDGLPARDEIGGIETHYMRQLYVPKIGVPVALPLYLASLAPYRALVRKADVVLGTWAYPDGCAAILAARAFGKPCVVKVHGTDVNTIAKRPSVRAILRRVLPRAGALVSVSAALSGELEELGVAREKIHLVRNGVDKGVFAPRGAKEKADARRALGVDPAAEVVLYVGRLETGKGMAELLAAIPAVRARVERAVFVVLGDGEWSERVAKAAAEAGGAIVAPGTRPLKEVAAWLAACDVLTLPSWMEGTPNVVLEALASGRPVVATNVGGIPAVLPDPDAGRLVPPRDTGALAEALIETLGRVRAGAFAPEKVAAFGPKSWKESAEELYGVLKGVLAS
jgi:glycosyltransferase involved in cell wall biosynthesis